MNIYSFGGNYIDAARNINGPNFAQSGDTKKQQQVSFIDFSYIRDSVTVDQKLQDKLNTINKIKELMEDLKNTALIKDKGALSNLKVEMSKNDANLGVSVEKPDEMKAENYTINVTQLMEGTVIASDDVGSTKALGIAGTIEINGIPIAVTQKDTLSNISEKITKGEDLNNNGKLDSGEDLNSDGKLITGSDLGVKSFVDEGKLYIETKTKGEAGVINISEKGSAAAKTIGVIGDEGEIKNLLQSGKNGEIEINGNKISFKDNVVTFNGLKIDLSKALENGESVINVTEDNDKVIKNLNEFKEKYNKLMDFVNNVVDNEDKELKSIKNKIAMTANEPMGLKVNNGTFYDKMLELKKGMGSAINESLKAQGIASNKNGQIEFDLDKVKENISNLSKMFNGSDAGDAISKLENNIQPYFEKVNVLDTKSQGVSEVLSKIEEKSSEKSKIEEILDYNQQMNDFLTRQAQSLNVDTGILFGKNKTNNSNNGNHGNGNNGNAWGRKN